MTKPAFRLIACALVLAFSLSSTVVIAGETTVAVAANFTAAATDIADAFKAETGHEAVLIFGSTGKLYAQIANGAPFDVFLAADDIRPSQAVADGFAVGGTIFTYAIGQIVLHSADPILVDTEGKVLETGDVARIAIPNPDTAPYGAAAVQAMKTLGVYEAMAPKIVKGDNLAQTLQFISTRNAPLGFVALSQTIGDETGSSWVVPTELYAPIRQDAVLLTIGADNEAARAFLDFLTSDTARGIIAGYGYGTD